MALILYTLSICGYRLLIFLASLFHTKARQWLVGRRQLFLRLESALKNNTTPVVWFHCASLGEFEQGRPVIEAYRTTYPGHRILLTFFSPSGYEVRKNYAGADFIFYLPLDTASNAEQFVRLVKPRLAFFVKYEFWYYYLQELHRQQVPIVSFSAIFREEQLFFKSYGGFYRKLLHYFDHLFVQNQVSLDLLRSIGITHASLAGDTRFDRVRQICEARKDIPLAAAFKNDRKLLVVGSSWPADTAVLVPFLNRFAEELKVIIAPHEIHEDEITNLQRSLTRKSVRFSRADLATIHEANVLIIDNIGMLSSLYQYAEFAYIGGAFGKGLHNILEAATFGMPLFFGPNHQRFQEAVDLIQLEAAFPVRETSDFERTFTQLFFHEEERLRKAAVTRSYVEAHTGATQQVMGWVKQINES